MSVRTQYIAFKIGPFALVPLAFLLVYVVPSSSDVAVLACFGAVLVGQIYAELFIRCPQCGWRVDSYGLAFVRSLPPGECPRCGTKLD